VEVIVDVVGVVDEYRLELVELEIEEIILVQTIEGLVDEYVSLLLEVGLECVVGWLLVLLGVEDRLVEEPCGPVGMEAVRQGVLEV
jgi:hypothetical protein